MDVHIVDAFEGKQSGTQANPYVARTTPEFDALLQALLLLSGLDLHLTGTFQTKGAYRWGRLASRNLGKDWTVSGDAEIALDVTVPPSARDNQPLYCLAGPAKSVSGVTTRGNHSILARDWQGTLRTGGVLLYNDDASIERVTFKDFGAIGAETFVAEVVGGGGAIRNSTYTQHDAAASDDQVTVFRTMAEENGKTTSLKQAIHEGNTTAVPSSRKVQAHTIYGSPGLVRGNKSVGADVFYYSDYFSNRGIEIHDNEAMGNIHGVQLKLSPTAGDNLEMPKYFSHEDYVIGPNKFASSGKDVSLDTMGPTTATRFIRNIAIHESLSFENVNDGATNITRIKETRRGCRFFSTSRVKT